MSDSQHDPILGDEQRLARGLERLRSTRRRFIENLCLSTGAAAVTATGCGDEGGWETFFQQHYKRLTEEDKQALVERLEEETQSTHGVQVRLSDPPPIEGVEFGYALNVTACIGCRRCEYACAEENNTSRDPEVHYIRVLEMDAGTFDVDTATHDYEGQVPRPGKFYLPVQCHQCADPPCVRACPVDATWQEPDGITVIDYDWCIGCRYCEAACPYFARRFNFAEPTIGPSEINPDQAILSNRLRPVGVVEKCHFCLHRVREGRYPACLEACPTGARKFGNLRDPESEVRQVLDSKQVYVFKEELGTKPRFFYYFD